MIVISPVPVDANAILPVPDVIETAVAPVALPRVIVLAAPPVPILIGWSTSSLPILIAPALEFNSNIPPASNNKVSSELIVISPVSVDANAILPVPEVIETAVVVLLLPILIISGNPPVPIDIVLSPCVPILIGWLTLSLPILILPPLEFNETPPALPTIWPPVPDVSDKAVLLLLLPITIVLAAAPVPTLIFWALVLLPILISPALEFNTRLLDASIVIPPALEVKAIAELEVPSSLITVIVCDAPASACNLIISALLSEDWTVNPFNVPTLVRLDPTTPEPNEVDVKTSVLSIW